MRNYFSENQYVSAGSKVSDTNTQILCFTKIMNVLCRTAVFRGSIKSITCNSTGKRFASTHVPPDLQYLIRGDGVKIAYRRYKPPKDKQDDNSKPGIIFCPGFQSTMEGVKALSLEKYCIEKGLDYVRFVPQSCIHHNSKRSLILIGGWKIKSITFSIFHYHKVTNIVFGVSEGETV